MSEENPESLNRCWLCFSKGRMLRGVHGVSRVFQLLTELVPHKGVRICWECRATLARIRRFQLQTFQALQMILSDQNCAQNELKGLSPLSLSSTVTLSCVSDSATDFDQPRQSCNCALKSRSALSRTTTVFTNLLSDSDTPFHQPSESGDDVRDCYKFTSTPFSSLLSAQSLDPVNPNLECGIDDEVKIEIEECEILPQCNAWVDQVASVKLVNVGSILIKDSCDDSSDANVTCNLPFNETIGVVDIDRLKRDKDALTVPGLNGDASQALAQTSETTANKVKVKDAKLLKKVYKEQKILGRRVDRDERSRMILSEIKDLASRGLLDITVGSMEQIQTLREAALRELPRRLQCVGCLESFAYKSDYERHMEKHVPEAGEHECEVCGCRFRTEESLGAHRGDHYFVYRCTDPKHIACTFVTCMRGSAFRHAKKKSVTGLKDIMEKLNVYIRTNRIERFTGTLQEVQQARRRLQGLLSSGKSARFVCKPCVVRFHSQPELDEHTARCHSETAGEYTCDICSCRFPTEASLEEHHAAHFTLYRCTAPELPDCGSLCPQPEAAVRHALYHENNYKRRRFLRDETSCDICGGVFSSRCYYVQHMKVHTSNRRYECDFCGRSKKTRSQIHRHLKQHVMRYMCEYCGKQCSTSTSLNMHYNAHKQYSEREFECHECNKKFINRSKLVSHLYVHSGEKTLQCADCERMFSEYQQLAHHRRTHHEGIKRGKKKFERTKSEYRNLPTRTVLGNAAQSEAPARKSYVCSICSKVFSNRCSLRLHFSVHSDARPYKCDICSKTYKAYTALKNHKTYVHKGIKPHKCDVCGKAFAVKSSLTTHQITHSTDKRFECCICHMKFKYPSKLSTHFKTHDVVKSVADPT